MSAATKARRPILDEIRLALTFGGVGMIGFCIDALVLHTGLELGLAAWGARLISLFCAMQATFVINGLHVFRSLDRKRLPAQWAGYMLANGFGNFCSYWIFLTLVSTHWPTVSDHYVALAAGSLSAWLINFTGTRIFVFRRSKAHANDAACGVSSLVLDDPSPAREPTSP